MQAKAMSKSEVHAHRSRFGVLQRQALWGMLFVTPAVLFFAIMWVYPLINAISISFTNWDLLSPAKFVGWKNYLGLVEDENFLRAAQATLFFAVGSGIPTALISLGLALLVNRSLPGQQFFRTVLFIPAITSWVVAAIVWRMIYLPDQGLYLLFTKPFGISGVQWLMSRDLAMVAAIIMAVWKQIGPNILVFLAGLQTLPDEVFDAAKVDGASPWQSTIYITLPLLRPTTLFVCVMLVISSLQNFTPMYVLTGGGPANVTRVISLLINQEAFQWFHMGKASAISTVMFAGVLVFTIVNIRLFGERRQ
jgi:ABC-type sugar transport system permease subunit